MPQPSYILLSVTAPRESAALYNRLLQLEPVELSDTFALYVLPTGWKLGLWRKDGVAPAPLPPGGAEIAFAQPDKAAVDAVFADWQGLGVEVLQTPVGMDFGYTFTVADADGHRLRVFALSDDPR